MALLFGSILATALVVQVQTGTIQGKVVDDQSKPLADVQVVFFTPRPWIGVGEPVSREPSRTPREDSGYRPRDCSARLTLGSGPIDRVRLLRRSLAARRRLRWSCTKPSREPSRSKVPTVAQ